jgi:hypothetical protein
MKEMQIEMTLRFHLIPVRIAVINHTNHNKCWQGFGGKKEHFYIVGGECKLVQPLWKAI